MECIQYNHKQRFSVDRFKFIDMKYIDSKLSLIKYLHYYLAKMEFFFVWIRRFLFGFCSNQWLIFVVRIIKTHTMVVHFSGHSRPKRKKTESTTDLELWSLLPEIIIESSIFLLAYLFWCCMLCSTSTWIAHIMIYWTEQMLLLSQKDRWCLLDIASFWSLIRFSFFLLVVISLSFLQRSFQFLLIVWGTIVIVDCIDHFEYFEYCLLIFITREFFHRKQSCLASWWMSNVIFLYFSSIFFFSLSAMML